MCSRVLVITFPSSSVSCHVTTVLSRVLTNAILLPSRDHAGCSSLISPPLKVSLVWLPPSLFITYTLCEPLLSKSRAKDIFVPSADQEGSPSSVELLLMFVWPLPSASITYT